MPNLIKFFTYTMDDSTSLKTSIHFPVHSKLTDYTTVIWEVYREQSTSETILPQGVIEIVFNLADGMTATQAHNRKKIQPARCFVQGLNTQTLTVSYAGKHNLFGIQLKPHKVKKLLGVVSSELKDSVVDLSLIDPQWNNLWNQLVEATNFDERVNIVEQSLPVLAPDDCPRTKKLSDLFYADNLTDFQSLDVLAEQVCYSSRHLNRKTQNIFGITAEELITYKKFLFSTRLIHNSNFSMTEIAHQSGFYDQAHFCRTFKSFANLTPSQYKSQKGSLPFHLFA
jgi:AraC-like DNA-binding protein